jgi:hypothetical protein
MQDTDFLFADDLATDNALTFLAIVATDFDPLDVDIADYNHAIRYGITDNMGDF